MTTTGCWLACALAGAAALLPLQSNPPALDNPEAQLVRAGALYYAPGRLGLTSFHCDLNLDWVQFMKAAASLGGHDPAEITADHPMVKSFAAAHITVDDPILSVTTVEVTGSGAMPEGLPADFGKAMAEGVKQTVRMFFDFWNPMVNGTLWDGTGSGVVIDRNGEKGVRVARSGADAQITEEDFDQDLLLTGFHARIDGYDSPVKPDFEQAGGVKRVQALHIAFKNPVSGATNEVTMRTAYARVGGYDLPASISTLIDGTEMLRATLTGCTVKSRR